MLLLLLLLRLHLGVAADGPGPSETPPRIRITGKRHSGGGNGAITPTPNCRGSTVIGRLLLLLGCERGCLGGVIAATRAGITTTPLLQLLLLRGGVE